MRKATTITFEGFVKYDRTLFDKLFFAIAVKVRQAGVPAAGT